MKNIIAALFWICAWAVYGEQVEISVLSTDTTARARLDWQSVPGQTYAVHTTTNLTPSQWTDATSGGLVISNVLGSFESPITNQTQFFRVVKEDTDPPTVASLSPGAAAIAVASNAAISIVLGDETGIDTNSILLDIGPWTGLTLAHPQVTWLNNTITFTPTSALEQAGVVLTNTLTVSDILGHTLSNFSWTFQLARTQVATSAFLPLTAPPSAGLKAMADGTMLQRSLPNVQPLDGNNEYHIVSVTSDTVVFSYSLGIPVISNGTILVSFDAAYPLYRSVVSNTLNEAQMQITAWTVDISLTNLVSEGSLTSVDFTPAQLTGSCRALLSYDGNLSTIFSNDLSGTVLYEDAGLKLWLPSAAWSFAGGVGVAFDIAWGRLQSLDASATGKFTLNATPQAIFMTALDGGASAQLVPPITHVFGGMVLAIPVWVKVTMELETGYAYSASASGSMQTTIAVEKELSFHVALRNQQWTTSGENPTIVLRADPLNWQLEGTANVNVHIQPKLTVLVYSLAGFSADIDPYFELSGRSQTDPQDYDLGVYFGLSSTLGIECRIPGITAPDPRTLFDQRWPLWSTSGPTDIKPTFVSDLRNQMVLRGKSLTLSAQASGKPAPQYKWFFNGTRVVGAQSSQFTIASAQPGHAGTYTAQAYNSAGSAEASCQVTVTDAEPPAQNDFSLPLRTVHSPLRQTQHFGDYFSVMNGFHSAEDWQYTNVTVDSQCVYSAGPGRVVWISDWKDGRGKVVAIEHTGSFVIPRKDSACPIAGQSFSYPSTTLSKVYSIYVHLTDVQVFSNQVVTVNTLLGKYMNAGTGPHLHFEIRLPETLHSTGSWSMFYPDTNWAKNGPTNTGYYINLQTMVDAGVDAGVREPISFIYANSRRAVSTTFTVGQLVQTSADSATKVRMLPSVWAGDRLASVPAGTDGEILDAAATGFQNGVDGLDGYSWWYVKFASVTGWCAEVRLSSTVPPDPTIDYLVVDLSAGPEATSYPVTTLSTVPVGGWTDEYKTTKMVFRRISAGTFTMGSPIGEPVRQSDETEHEVTLTQPFYIGIFEVTQKQWDRVMGNWPSYFNNSSYRDTRPVEEVSYSDIRGPSSGTNWPGNGNVDTDSFMGKLRARTGKAFDLPTESQWEYAGRAGTSTAINSGKNLTDAYQCSNMSEVGRYWYSGGSGSSQDCAPTAGTATVGSYLPNAWGLYDMHGNVWEWCLDWYAPFTSSTAVDPKGAPTGSVRVFRGGSWYYLACWCRIAFRDANYTGIGQSKGFRVALPTEHTLTDGLVAYYPFNGNANDESGKGAHGTVHDATLTVDRFGVPNCAFWFDGINDFIQIPNSDLINFDSGDDFSCSVWIQLPQTQTDLDLEDNAILEKWSFNNGYPFVIRYMNESRLNNRYEVVACQYDGTTGCMLTSGTKLNDDTFHHIVYVKRSPVLSLFVDGHLAGQTNFSPTATTKNTSDLYVGRRGVSGSYDIFLRGSIDDIRIYNRALTAAEILQLSAQ